MLPAAGALPPPLELDWFQWQSMSRCTSAQGLTNGITTTLMQNGLRRHTEAFTYAAKPFSAWRIDRRELWTRQPRECTMPGAWAALAPGVWGTLVMEGVPIAYVDAFS